MNCSALTLYKNPCKNKDFCENGLCKKHTIIEPNAKPKKKENAYTPFGQKCFYIYN